MVHVVSLISYVKRVIIGDNLANNSAINALVDCKIKEDARTTRGYSSVVEHSTADRRVPSSNLGAPFLLDLDVLHVPL